MLTSAQRPILRFNMFNNARHVHIENSAINFATQSHGKLGLQLLLQKTAAGATYDSAQLESHAPCHPMTRKTVLRRIMDWVNTTEHQSDILWLRGPAGAGKSSILKTICSSCREAGVLGGSFFFLRNLQQLNSPRCLVTTLAYQLAIAFPELGDWINEVVGQDPSIFDKTIEQQLQRLIVEPALAADFGRSHRRVVFVVDGLDECVSEEAQCQIIRLISSIFKHHRAPFCFIIASRPEPWIRDEFESDVFKHNLQQVSLEQSDDTDQDICTFLTHEFVDMCESPRHAYSMSDITKPWPPSKDIDMLVHRASGQFIYAVTVLRFVDDPNYHPPNRLRLVLDIPLTTQLNPLAELDKLYMQIMGTCVDKKRTLDVLATLLTMLTLRQTSTLVTPFVWFPRLELLDVAGCLLGLGPNEAYRALRMIHSLVKISPLSNEEREKASFNAGYWHETINRPDAIAFHHKSFPDFLLDSRRSGCCFVDIDSAHRSTGLACLDIMKGLSSKQPSRINYAAWGYALLYWHRHFCASGPPSKETLCGLRKFEWCHYVLAFPHYTSLSPQPKILSDMVKRFVKGSTTHPPNNIPITEIREHIDAASKYLTEGSISWILPAFLSTRGLEKLAAWVRTSEMHRHRMSVHIPLVGYSMHVWKLSRRCRDLARLSSVVGPRSIKAHTTVYAVALAPIRARHLGKGLLLAVPSEMT